MMNRSRGILLAIAALAAVTAVTLHNRQVSTLRAEARASDLALDSVRAVTDSLTHVIPGLVRAYAAQSNEVRGLRNQVVQLASRATARVDTVRDTVRTPAAVDSAGTIVASQAVDETPFHLRTSIEIASPYRYVRWSNTMALDPVNLVFNVSCTPAGRIQRGAVDLRTPPWLKVSDLQTNLDAGVCNPQPARPRFMGVPAGTAVAFATLVGFVAGGILTN